MQLKIADAISDAQKFIAQLERLMQGKKFEDYSRDEMLELAVKMDMVLIAEALRRLDRATPEAVVRISELHQIVSFRNVLVHGYDIVDEDIAWDTLTQGIPLLKQQIDAWANELGMEPPPGQAA